MDDLSAQLNQILSDPQSMSQIQSLISSMGLGGDSAKSSPPPPQPSGQSNANALASLLGSGSTSASSPLAGADMISAFTRLAPLLSQIQQEDDSTRLLHALRPMLSEKRQKKVDEAVRIIHLLRLLPLIKETGILGSLLE